MNVTEVGKLFLPGRTSWPESVYLEYTSQRLVGLGTKFSREFRAMILRQLERPFSQEAYDEAVHQTYRRLSSDDLLARADIKCRI